mmetsp:Transcript_11697/g.31503  ORF Transcript_11697/g.31503 Transcript_11697/m.31503 type:complete len:82 (-) Transcript_11697:570-815(-)
MQRSTSRLLPPLTQHGLPVHASHTLPLPLPAHYGAKGRSRQDVSNTGTCLGRRACLRMCGTESIAAVSPYCRNRSDTSGSS